MAAQKALELSILPDEVEGECPVMRRVSRFLTVSCILSARRNRKEKNRFVKNSKQLNKSAQLFLTTSETDLRKATMVRKEANDDEIQEIQSDEPSAASNISRGKNWVKLGENW